jgi:aminoglycoside phosphotransferase family enzyme/predicted kinase
MMMPMELPELIRALSDPAAYPFPAGAIEVRQTHISVVFLAGEVVYKIKKPVNLGFLDFSTLERRHHFCDQEVRLNRRLAGDVYLDVVPITKTGDGLRIEGHGEPIEWAVKMQRLADADTLEHRLLHGEITAEFMQSLAQKIATFHTAAARGDEVSRYGRFEVVAANARENFEQSAGGVGVIVSPQVFDRLRALTEAALAAHHDLIEARAARGVPCDTHGDLRLDHVYLRDGRQPPDDVVVIDCIEFNERFRFADPVADVAFLVMGLDFIGRRDLAAAFAEAWFRTSADDEGRALLPFYTAYRAAVRGKVEAIKLSEREVSEADRAAAMTMTHGYWLLALGELESPSRRPCLVMIGGLPGTGKSTLAADLADRAGFTVIRSDVVRKELAGPLATQQQPSAFGGGIYTLDWTLRTYAECLRRAEALLFEGQRVIVDASFRCERERLQFLAAAHRWGVQGLFLICQTDPEVARHRLADRRGDASDADWSIYERAAEQWEEPGRQSSAVWHPVNAGADPRGTLEHALGVLRQAGLDA